MSQLETRENGILLRTIISEISACYSIANFNLTLIRCSNWIFFYTPQADEILPKINAFK